MGQAAERDFCLRGTNIQESTGTVAKPRVTSTVTYSANATLQQTSFHHILTATHFIQFLQQDMYLLKKTSYGLR